MPANTEKFSSDRARWRRFGRSPTAPYARGTQLAARICLIAVAVLLGLLLPTPAVAADERPVVALDLTGLDDSQYQALDGLGLEKRLVLRLIQEGFAVVGRGAQPGVVVQVAIRAQIVSLTALGGGHTQAREVAWDRQAELELVHLEISQKVVELVRALRTMQVPTPKQPAAVRDPAANGASQPLREAIPRLSVGLDAGVVVRPPSVDPLTRLRAELRLGGAWWAELGARGVSAFSAGIRVLEIQPEAGFGAEVRLTRLMSLAGAVRAGLVLHSYALDDSLNDGSAVRATGVRAGGLFALPIRVSIRPFSPLRVDLVVTPGLATGGRSHILNGNMLWHRGPAELEFALGLVFEF